MSRLFTFIFIQSTLWLLSVQSGSSQTCTSAGGGSGQSSSCADHAAGSQGGGVHLLQNERGTFKSDEGLPVEPAGEEATIPENRLAMGELQEEPAGEELAGKEATPAGVLQEEPAVEESSIPENRAAVEELQKAVAGDAYPTAKQQPEVCQDVRPPADWNYNTCEAQVQNRPDLCEQRRSGQLTDGYCHKSCGVCSTACQDVQPPADWTYNTCEAQVQKRPDLCERRRSGQLTDGYCHKSCGVCSTAPTTTTTTTKALVWVLEFENQRLPLDQAYTTEVANIEECKAKATSSGRTRFIYEVGTCTDTEPPAQWTHNTCEAQVLNRPDLCEQRRTGQLKDGYCHESCKVCSRATARCMTPDAPAYDNKQALDGWNIYKLTSDQGGGSRPCDK